MGTEVESISPSELWKGRSTRSNIHSTEAPDHRVGVTNSTTVNNSSPTLSLPISPSINQMTLSDTKNNL